MATQRYISTSFWDDEWITTLDPSEKLLYLYLMTNTLTNISGVYKIAVRRICFDTGFNSDTVGHIMTKFEKAKKAHRIGEYIAIPSWPKHQNCETRLKIKEGVSACLKELPKEVLIELVKIGYKFNLKPVFDILSIPYIYDTNYSDSDSDSDSDIDIDIEAEATEVPSLPSEPAKNIAQDQGDSEQSPILKREKKARKKNVPVRDNPPKLDEVQEYFEKNKLLVNADNFYAYYTASEWKNKGGDDILNWRLTAVTWNNREKAQNRNAVPYQRQRVNESGQRLFGTIQGLKFCPNPICENARLTGDTCPRCRTTYALDGSVRYKGDY